MKKFGKKSMFSNGKQEELLGIPPEEVTQNISLFSKYRDTFTVYKSPSKGKKTFTITSTFLDTLFQMKEKINKTPQLIITLGNYVLTCSIKKVGDK